MGDLRARLQAALGDAYRIGRELGGGGMSRVFLAHEAALGRPVVVKVLPPDMAAGVNVERFRREIQLAASLQHPHIVPLLSTGASGLPAQLAAEVNAERFRRESEMATALQHLDIVSVPPAGQRGDLLYYVMPFVEGESLRAKLAREGELPLGETIRILTDVADALAYAHAHGVVHRDIKPDNVLLAGKHALVTDFGVAKAVSASSGGWLTSLGVALGTPAYMAPEQAAADPHMDHRADLYALGVVGYEMLTARPPFVGATPQATLAAQVTQAPEPVTAQRPSVPAALNALVMRCLEKHPADRWQTATEVLQQLEAMARPSGGVAPTGEPLPSGTRAAPWRRLVLVGVAAVVVGAGALLALRRGRVAPSPNSVAVLFLANLSRDTADAFLADGLTEEVIIRLGQVPRLDVKSRFEVQRFRDPAAQDLPALGRALHAAYVVTGSVQRAGDRVRLRYEVIRAATRTEVGGDVIDRASSDLLTVESDIARQVAMAILSKVLPEERAQLNRPITSDPAAYEEYLRGRQALNNSLDEASLRSALVHFDRAIARDPSFAAAFASKAQAWSGLADGFVSGREGYGLVRTAAAQALKFDSSQALAYAMLGLATLALDWDAHEAERLARRAVALNPRGDPPHFVLCTVLAAEGRMDESIEEGRRAWQADSLVSANGVIYALMLLYGHRLDAVASMLPRLRAVLPAADVDFFEGELLAARGDLQGAAHLLNWRYYGGMAAGTYVRVLLARRDTVAARAIVDSMLAARPPEYVNPVALAKVFAALGDVDRGLAWLRRAFDERTYMVELVRLDDELAPLRADPRYAALDRQLRY